MKILITGAGQIGNAIVRSLRATGDDVTVIRRSTHPIEGVRVISGDAGERALLEREARSADAIMHCIHAPYTAQAWREELPHREQAVMDVAASLGIPVVFPESVYAFEAQAHDLHEGAPIHPCSPLGACAPSSSKLARHMRRTPRVSLPPTSWEKAPPRRHRCPR